MVETSTSISGVSVKWLAATEKVHSPVGVSVICPVKYLTSFVLKQLLFYSAVICTL